MKFIEDITLEGYELNVREYYDTLPIDGVCVYAYLREEDDEHGPAGSVRYIGEGIAGRPTALSGRRVRVPDREYIRVLIDGFDKTEALLVEDMLILMFGKIKGGDGILENTNRGRPSYNPNRGVKVRDKNGNVTVVKIDDPRYISGELVHINKGMVVATDSNGNKVRVQKDDPRFAAGELFGNTKGMTMGIDKDGNKVRAVKDDERFKNGELVFWTKGTVTVKDKDGNNLRVSKDDPRYISGELVPTTRGTCLGYDKDGNKVKTVKGDPRFASGELVGPNNKKRFSRLPQ